MTFHGQHSEQYITGRELGRGGEGTVYDLQNDGSRVLKKYNEPLSPLQIQKLHKMVLMRTPAIDAYAAWPQALVRDSSETVCGFVMKKLTGFVPLHMIFSPLDRKKMFPDKGYNFLVHVARNLAVAFHKLHEAGLVVGDVNEGNILINASGMVNFIDCDSFQVRGDDGWFYCEVGVPRYTPPELLEAQTFEHVVRTTNTDSFSLAILIFQLLFLGRHPFAGRNKSAADIDEETAIKMHEFAYSLSAKRKKLLPPNDSFDINNLTQPLIDQFHRSFETEERPLPADWIKALDGFLTEMITCGESRLHAYPAKMKECPWCFFKRTRGIMYFLDDTYMKANNILADIEQFVNGFKVEHLEVKKWDKPLSQQLTSPTSIEKEWRDNILYHWLVGVGILVLATVLYSTSNWPFVFLYGCVFALMWHFAGSYSRKIRKYRRTLLSNYSGLTANREKLVQNYNYPPDLSVYDAGVDHLHKLVKNFRELPLENERLEKEAEEIIYNQHLDQYLRQVDILSHHIPSFGDARKNMLLNAGIRNAADIGMLTSMRVNGIGPKNIQILLNWRLQLSGTFVYIPDTAKLSIAMSRVSSKLLAHRTDLEHKIRQQYQSISYIRQNIQNRALVLEVQLNDAILSCAMAKDQINQFKKLSRFI